jgi:Fur family ferric uptake transcriptional regulator
MSGHGQLVEALRGTGYRLTPQRLMILGIVHDNEGHITAEKVHEKVREQYPYVDISTVYRTLQLLKRLRVVTETDLGGGSVEYELTANRPHHHLVCHNCSKTIRLDDGFVQPLRDRLREDYGFEADMDHFAMFGICKDCREQAAASQ